MVDAKEIIKRLLELEIELLKTRQCIYARQMCDSINSGLVVLKWYYPKSFDHVLEARLRSYYSHFGYVGAAWSS